MRMFRQYIVACRRGSSVNLVAELRAGQPAFDSWQGRGFSSRRHRGHTDYEVHPASCQIGTRCYLPGDEAAGA